jgi:ABC-2 type transport system ATP-binding protein
MINAIELSKKYSGTVVLNIPELEIPKGQSFGLVGNNGAGKTTFFNLLLDLIKPTTGKIINQEIQVNTSEDWKPFTSAYIDESFFDRLPDAGRVFQFYRRATRAQQS